MYTNKYYFLNTESIYPNNIIDVDDVDEETDELLDSTDVDGDDNKDDEVMSMNVDELSKEYGQQQFLELERTNNNKLQDQQGHQHLEQKQKEVTHSRILKDVFHLMDILKISQKHGLSKIFKRAFRDTLFIIDDSDKELISNVLIKQGITWNKKLAESPDWIFRRVRRTFQSLEKMCISKRLYIGSNIITYFSICCRSRAAAKSTV